MPTGLRRSGPTHRSDRENAAPIGESGGAGLLALRDSGVRFVAVDMPEANDLTVGIMALVAQAERAANSRQTKEALAVAKACGVKLGNPNGAAGLRRAGKGGEALRAAVSANAATFAADLAPVLADIKAAGHSSLRAIAAGLTVRGIKTRRGGKWSVGDVGRLISWLERVVAGQAVRHCEPVVHGGQTRMGVWNQGLGRGR